MGCRLASPQGKRPRLTKSQELLGDPEQNHCTPLPSTSCPSNLLPNWLKTPGTASFTLLGQHCELSLGQGDIPRTKWRVPASTSPTASDQNLDTQLRDCSPCPAQTPLRTDQNCVGSSTVWFHVGLKWLFVTKGLPVEINSHF